jgi:NAD(P)-dependent dehydrogenase (short-subunit alcohol dehydrogenase family)
MKSVLVTGSNGGIGTAICLHFKQEGYKVFGTDLLADSNDLDGYIQFDIRKLATEISKRKEFSGLIEELVGTSELVCLINNAAIQILSSIEELEIEDFINTIDTNLVAPLILSKFTFPYLKKNNGSIVNIGSIHSKLTKPGFISYATSKSGLLGLTQAMAVDAGNEVRVNAILPAAIETQMLKEGFSENDEDYQQLCEFHPVGRIGKVEEVAELVYFLTNSNTQFLNGTTIDMSGGMHCRLHDPQ